MSPDFTLNGERVEGLAQEVVIAPTTARSIVVFTSGQRGLEAARALLDLNGVENVTVIQVPRSARRLNSFAVLRHAFKYGGLRSVADEIVQAAMRLVGHNRAVGHLASPSPEVQVMEFGNFHDKACIEALHELAPDLGVAVDAYRLHPSVLSVPRLGSLGLHLGRVPDYWGSPPVFWELYNGETRIGVTVSRVSSESGAGPILRQEVLPMQYAPRGNPLEYAKDFERDILIPNGLRVLVDTVQDVMLGRAEPIQPAESRAKSYSLPTYIQKQRLRRRVSHRHSPGYSRRLRAALGWMLFRSGLYRVLIGNRAFIVLFHRVDDRYPASTITCSTREFDAYCGFFSKYFDVVSLTSLVDTLERNEACRGKLVVTFDDGYADNVAAAQLMKRHGVTGCFYIATDFVGTQKNGWWDIEQGYSSHWMSWDDIRQLDAWDFELGAHTATHVDLGRVSGAEAAVEIRKSIDALETALGKRIHHFAYPYGGRNNITPSNLEKVKASGLRTCTSAYGGMVVPGSDRYNLRRIAVSPWHRSVWQLGLEMLLERNTGN